MKRFPFAFATLVVLMMPAVWLIMSSNRIASSDIRVGDTWEFVVNEGDPFKGSTCHYFLVLQVKDGWVQYEEIYDRGTEYESVSEPRDATAHWFKVGAHRL